VKMSIPILFGTVYIFEYSPVFGWLGSRVVRKTHSLAMSKGSAFVVRRAIQQGYMGVVVDKLVPSESRDRQPGGRAFSPSAIVDVGNAGTEVDP